MSEISLPQDPAPAAAVLEIESHIAEAGWDQPARLYAPGRHRADRRAGADPGLADGPRRCCRRGFLHAGRAGRTARPAARRSRSRRSCGRPRCPAVPRSWRGSCCRRVWTRRSPTTPLPPRSSPATTRCAGKSASSPAPRARGATYCALRLRAHDDDQSVVDGTELVPGLLELLRSTLEEL
ncbi:hypothetical protein LP418_18300 [Nocardioides sp. B-3]|nr:hypothetical protein LP418_18300 [Nocardioides sp. B-3]